MQLTHRHVSVVLALVLGASAGCSENTADLVEAAERFHAPADWDHLSEGVSSEPACFHSDCKTLVMRWAASEPPGREELTTAASAWEEVEVDECTPRDNVTGPVPYCELTATHDGVDLTVSAVGPIHGDRPWQIVLQAS